MRKWIVILMLAVCLPALTGCGQTESTGSVKNNDVSSDVTMEEPPALTVDCNQESIEALKGTFSWIIKGEEDTSLAITSDSAHPLDCRELMQPLVLYNSGSFTNDGSVNKDSINNEYAENNIADNNSGNKFNNNDSGDSQFQASLNFGLVPDEVSVRCWSEDCWENVDAENENLAVDILQADSSVGASEARYFVNLKDGNYIYEVMAEWNSLEKYSGRAFYSFYTVKSELDEGASGTEPSGTEPISSGNADFS